MVKASCPSPVARATGPRWRTRTDADADEDVGDDERLAQADADQAGGRRHEQDRGDFLERGQSSDHRALAEGGRLRSRAGIEIAIAANYLRPCGIGQSRLPHTPRSIRTGPASLAMFIEPRL
jgi:hypothetical protein